MASQAGGTSAADAAPARNPDEEFEDNPCVHDTLCRQLLSFLCLQSSLIVLLALPPRLASKRSLVLLHLPLWMHKGWQSESSASRAGGRSSFVLCLRIALGLWKVVVPHHKMATIMKGETTNPKLRGARSCSSDSWIGRWERDCPRGTFLSPPAPPP